MNFIEELYYGNINPCEKKLESNSQCAKALERFCMVEEKLSKELKGEELSWFIEAVNASDEITACTGLENFKTGFVLGARMMAECFDQI